MADNVVVTVPEREIIAGRDGRDGFDPIIESEPILGGHRVTITGRSTVASFQVMDGTDGLSAYQQAVIGGYEGTEAQFNQELRSFKTLSEQAAASAESAAAAQEAAEAAQEAAEEAHGAAESSATAASESASAADASATGAALAATNASTSASNAVTSASAASSYASNAASSATAASGSADSASASATAAASAQSAAEAAQSAAASSASSASSSATAAGNAQSAAETAQGAAESAAQSVSQSAAQIGQNTADISNLKSTIVNMEGYQEGTYNDTFYVTDNSGNVVAKIDENGVDAIGYKQNGEAFVPGNPAVIDEYQSKFYVCDPDGYVIFKADKNGIDAPNLSIINIEHPYAGKKLVSIGDSLSTSGKWQTWLAKWTGCQFDADENTQGDSGYPAPSVGGSAIMPEVESSIYIRTLSIAHYGPELVVIYAGQNDARYFYLGGNEIRDGILGTINDVPYKKTVPYGSVPSTEYTDYTNQSGPGAVAGAPTVYAAAMGMIENIMSACPTAIIRCVNPMYMWCEVPNSSGYTTEQPPYRGPLAKMWEDICDKYNIKMVDLWKESGVSKGNAPSYYNGVGNVHFNNTGYKRVAECVYETL